MLASLERAYLATNQFVPFPNTVVPDLCRLACTSARLSSLSVNLTFKSSKSIRFGGVGMNIECECEATTTIRASWNFNDVSLIKSCDLRLD